VGADDLLTALTGTSRPAVRAVVATAPRSAAWCAVRAERIAAPVLFIAGGDDRRGPATAVAELMWSRRRGSGHEQDDRYLTFAGGGRLLRPPLTPTTGAGTGAGGTPEGLARAEAGAWRAVLEFLRDYLA
jgi:dienelactone hydrolase